MDQTDWDVEGPLGEDKDDVWTKFVDEHADHFGMRTALLVSALACFIAAIWLMLLQQLQTP